MTTPMLPRVSPDTMTELDVAGLQQPTRSPNGDPTTKSPNGHPNGSSPPSPETRTRPRRPGLRVSRGLWSWLVGICAALAIITLVVVSSPTLRHQAALSFTRLPTPYTEMFFTHPNNLPDLLSPHEPARPVSVTIRNHGTAPGHVTYTYDATITGSGHVQSLPTGRLTISSGGTGTFAVLVKPSFPSTTYVVTIWLRGTPDLLRFRAEGP